jgi:hypothetical protein
VIVPSCKDIVICWLTFYPIYEHLVEQTHLYASQAIIVAQYLFTGYTLHLIWVPMIVEEIRKFLGLTFITGIIKKPKQKCIGQMSLFLAHESFHNNAFLHSSDSSLRQAHACDMLSHKFFQMYAPLQHLAVDRWMLACQPIFNSVLKNWSLLVWL